MSGGLLAGRTAVVTGGSSGIGLASARLLATEGATVTIAGRSEQRLAAAAEELGPGTRWIATDLSSAAGAARLAAALREHGTTAIDILFANAGASNAPELFDTTEETFDQVIDTNLKSTFFTVLECAGLLADHASVILTASVGYHNGRIGDPLYNAAKAGVRALGRGFAAQPEFLQRSIRVNTVSFGAVATPMTGAGAPEYEAALQEWAETEVPLRRWAEPVEAAGAVLFLAGPHSTYLTGAEIPVDGGLVQL
ncbi:SDR family NAD(P)-dependent oxidoreductase [Kribbella sp. NPDC051587]|uniref:SDR family NAD(P)-dependent oxidoreductase n=1 Tax=Kribbella sp. NPDC051587 TaxID=3364119 RepID=UPI0037AFAC89